MLCGDLALLAHLRIYNLQILKESEQFESNRCYQFHIISLNGSFANVLTLEPGARSPKAEA